MANIQKKKFSKFQIKSAFEYFNSLVSQPGKRPAYSSFIFTNHTLLAPVYNSIMASLQPQPDPALQAVMSQRQAISNSDTDPVKVGEALEKFDREHAEDLQKVQAAMAAERAKANEVLAQVVEIPVAVLTLSEFVDDAPPFIVGLFQWQA
jgi:hypothetical protein